MGVYKLLHNSKFFWGIDDQLVYVSSATGDLKPGRAVYWEKSRCRLCVYVMSFDCISLEKKYFSCTYTAVVRRSNPFHLKDKEAT